MADAKTTALPEVTAPVSTDVAYLVDDPGGTPISSKITLANLAKGFVTGVFGGQSLTGSDADTLLDLSTTWNTTGNPTGLKFNVTHTAAGATSKLFDFQKGGVSYLSMPSSGGGDLTLAAAGRITNGSSYYSPQSSGHTFGNLSGNYVHINAGKLNMHKDVAFGWTDTSAPNSGNIDTTMYREGIGIVSLRNSLFGPADGAFRIYNDNGTWDATTNYERGYAGWNGDVFEIGTQIAGTGVGRSLNVLVSGTRILGSDGSFIQADKTLWIVPGANTTASQIASYSLSGSSDVEMCDWSGTWNTTGTPTLIKANVTDTASNAASLLMDLQVGGASKVAIDKTGTIVPDKTTADEGFINFKATADADATSAISTLTTSGSVTHHIQIEINGVTAWIPCSTTDPS